MHLQLALAVIHIANAALLPAIAPRGPGPGCEPEYEDIPLAEFNYGTTEDSTAGIGAEFEAPFLQFKQKGCSLANTFQAKRKKVTGRAGTNFWLSVDTSSEFGAGTLVSEYVLDGTKIKVGDGSAAAAGKAVQDDFFGWKPWTEKPPNQVTIEAYSQCPGPWTVQGLDEHTDKKVSPHWFPQATAPMPLEAIYSLLKENLLDLQGDDRNFLNGRVVGLGTRQDDLHLVTKDWFQALGKRMDIDNVNDAVLGFCSLVMSYAKGAKKHWLRGEEGSPKIILTVMPRTEFVTLFKQVKPAFPPSGELYDIFNVLACYKTTKAEQQLKVEIDTTYCSGTVANPVPNNVFGGLQYDYHGNFPNQHAPQTFRIQNWIDGIDHGNTQPDLLTAFDVNYDASIGGLNKALEKMHGSSRLVPLFEFRDFDPLFAPSFEDFMSKIDAAVQKMHADFLRPPSRRVKRQAGASSCGLPSPTSAALKTTRRSASPMITAPPSIKCSVVGPSPGTGVDEGYCDCVVGGSSAMTFPLRKTAGANSESCAYTTVPSATAAIKTDTTSWTSNCQACTLVGGEGGGHQTCTKVSHCTPTTSAITTPTIVAWVANGGTIDIGNAEDGGDGGKGLASEMFNKLSAMCDDSGCKSDHQEMDKVEVIVADGEEPLKPAMYVDQYYYQSIDVFKKMLAVGLSSWISALENPSLKRCTEVEYEADADATGSGCGSGPIPTDRLRRKVRRDNGTVLWERDGLLDEEHVLRERCLDDCVHPTVCHYKARMCLAPDSFTVVSGSKTDPYANHLTVNVVQDHSSDGFDCQEIAAGLTAAMALLAPELLEEDALEGIELEALCGVLEDPGSALSGLTPGSKRVVSRKLMGRLPGRSPFEGSDQMLWRG